MSQRVGTECYCQNDVYLIDFIHILMHRFGFHPSLDFEVPIAFP